VGGSPFAWAVKFYSAMCSSCQAFEPDWQKARESVDGLHWAAVNIDNKANIGLAKRMGVLTEGIPNVKLFNAGEVPLAVVTGDTPTAEVVATELRAVLGRAGAQKDDAGYYLGAAKTEL